MRFQVLFEDNHFIAVNKPPGALVQGDITGDMPLVEMVKNYVKDRYNKPGAVFLGVVHRLDRPVSGVCIFARTSKGLTRLNELFRNRDIEKTYWAVTHRRPEPYEGHLTHYILKDTTRNIAKAFDQPSNRNSKAKKADLDYKLLATVGTNHLVEVKPLTGRPHQIRVQFAKMGSPLRGDLKYGSNVRNSDGNIHLHSRSLSFIHPIKKEPVYIEADPPNEQVWNEFRHLWD